jgi:hypothetical protein
LKFEPGNGRVGGHERRGQDHARGLDPRFYDVTSGRISLDGADIQDLTLGRCAGRSASFRNTLSVR